MAKRRKLKNESLKIDMPFEDALRAHPEGKADKPEEAADAQGQETVGTK